MINYDEVKSDCDSCPNWVFIDLVHECSGENGLDWCGSLAKFVEELNDYIYGDVNHGEEFYVSIKGDKFLIGDEVLENATLVFEVSGEDEEDGLNPFYDKWVKYQLREAM